MIRFNIGTANISKIDDGDFIGVQPSALGAEPGVGAYELLHWYGFAARPTEPDADGTGCTTLEAEQGSQGFAWLANDPRMQSKLPNLKAGESLQYGPKGQFVRCHADGAITIFTTDDATTAGRSIFLRISPEITEPSGRVRQALEFESPHLRITAGSNGFHVRHSSGARLDLGSIGGLPSPLDAMASYATLTAAVASIQASAVARGTDGGATHTAALTALAGVLTAMAAAIDSKTGATTAMTAAVAAALPAIEQIGAVV